MGKRQCGDSHVFFSGRVWATMCECTRVCILCDETARTHPPCCRIEPDRFSGAAAGSCLTLAGYTLWSKLVLRQKKIVLVLCNETTHMHPPCCGVERDLQ